MSGAVRHFDAPDGARLAYRDEGEGLPVLCLSGLTRNGTDFDYVAPHLADVRLVRADYRGRGASAWADPATYTVPAEAADALALLDLLGIERAAVLGTSRGGIIGMYLAATAKDRLLGVCLNDIGPVLEPEGLAAIRGYVGRNPEGGSLDALARERARLMPAFRDVPEERWMEEARRHYVPAEGGGYAINYDPALASALDGPAPPDAWPLFDALEGLPIALLRGAGSDLLGPGCAAEMRRRRPDMAFAEIPGRGHVPFLDEPESLAAIRAWLDALR